MEKFSLVAIGRQQLDAARAARSGRAAQTVYGGHEHVLRQTLVALRAGARLDEHDSPGEATVQVLSGRIVLVAASASWEGATGALLVVPPERHSVEALEDSTFLLTVAKYPR